MNNVNLFQDFQKENGIFSRNIIKNIEEIIKLNSQHAHEEYIQGFEKQFADYNESKYVIAVNSGTTALQLALQASGIQKNDEVILPSYTYIATALAVSNLEAKPVFVDIKKDTLTVNPEEVKKKITKKTKAIIAVHIHGNPCDMNNITKIAKEYDIKIIEDASHAHGAEYNDVKVGNFGIGCFSCSMSKNLACLGNAGLITTDNYKIYETMVEMIKVNNDPSLRLSNRTPCRIGILEAAILRAKLPYLNKIITRKRNIASFYKKNLPKQIYYQKEEKGSNHVYRDFVILSENRTRLKDCLENKKIKTNLRYINPLHLIKYYRYLGYKTGDLPVTEKICRQVLCIPIYYFLLENEVQYVTEILRNLRFNYT